MKSSYFFLRWHSFCCESSVTSPHTYIDRSSRIFLMLSPLGDGLLRLVSYAYNTARPVSCELPVDPYRNHAGLPVFINGGLPRVTVRSAPLVASCVRF